MKKRSDAFRRFPYVFNYSKAADRMTLKGKELNSLSLKLPVLDPEFFIQRVNLSIASGVILPEMFESPKLDGMSSHQVKVNILVP